MLTSPTSTYGWVVFECSIIATWLKRLKRGFYHTALPLAKNLINVHFLRNIGIPFASAYFGCFMTTKSDHELVPVHELMSEKEVKTLLDSMGMTLEGLPKIFDTDPQAVKLGAKTGQVIKIYRREGKREIPYYRVVVEG